MNTRKRVAAAAVPLLALAGCWDPPLQPTTGPGGSDYAHAPVVKRQEAFASGCGLLLPCPPISFFEPALPPGETPRVLIHVNGAGEDTAAPACAPTRDMGTFIGGPAVNKIQNAGDPGI
jgi:hypothetical protein